MRAQKWVFFFLIALLYDQPPTLYYSISYTIHVDEFLNHFCTLTLNMYNTRVHKHRYANMSYHAHHHNPDRSNRVAHSSTACRLRVRLTLGLSWRPLHSLTPPVPFISSREQANTIKSNDQWMWHTSDPHPPSRPHSETHYHICHIRSW